MSECYEIIFEQVAFDDLYELVRFIERESRGVSGLVVSEDLGEISSARISRRLIDKAISYVASVCMVEQLHELNFLGVISLRLVWLRVVKYEGKVDVELSFNDVPPIAIDHVMLAAQRYAERLSKKFNIKIFYGGLEPAGDTDTRYFTGNTLGSL